MEADERLHLSIGGKNLDAISFHQHLELFLALHRLHQAYGSSGLKVEEIERRKVKESPYNLFRGTPFSKEETEPLPFQPYVPRQQVYEAIDKLTTKKKSPLLKAE